MDINAPAWTRQRMLAFDIESTGVDVREDRIVTATVAYVGGGEETAVHSWLADPGIEISEGAAEVHGITTEKARDEGKPASEVINEIIDCFNALPHPAPVVIFNAPFDLTMFLCEARRHGRMDFDIGAYDRPMLRHVIDPLVIDKHLDKYRRGSRKLEAMCEHHNVTLDGAHDATFDAIAAARLAYRLGTSGKVVRRVRNAQDGRELAALVSEWNRARMSLIELNDAQMRWAAQQAIGLRNHFAEKGEIEKSKSVELGWPIRPLETPAPDPVFA